MIRWHGVAGVLVAVLVLGAFAPSGVYAQSAEEVRKSIQDMRKQLDTQQKRLEQLETEQALQQLQQKKTETTMQQAITRQVLESQPPMALLGPAAMPPSAFGLGLFAGVDFQWVKFRSMDWDYAIQNFSSNNSTFSPNGKAFTVGVDREFAPRYTVGYYIPGGRGVVSANYMHIDNEGTADVAVREVRDSSICGVLGPVPDVHFEFGAACSASAKNRVRLDQFDIQYQYPIQVTKTFVLTPEVGVRALWFLNDLKADYFGCESCATETELFYSIHVKDKSHGVGPKLALGATWEPLNGLTLGAQGVGGFLVGNTTASHEFCRGVEFSRPGCGGSHNISTDESMGFPFVGGDFSVRYAFPSNSVLKGLSLFAGYRIVSYFDMIITPRLIGEGETGEAGLLHSFWRKNLTADSAYFGLQYIF